MVGRLDSLADRMRALWNRPFQKSQDRLVPQGGQMRHAAKLLGVCSGLFALTTVTAALASERGQVRANGMTIAFESFGSPDRETVLLVAGTGMQLTGWPIQLCEELVSRGYRVVIYDNRDIGLSTRLDAAGKPDFAAVVQASMAGKPAPLSYTLY